MTPAQQQYLAALEQGEAIRQRTHHADWSQSLAFAKYLGIELGVTKVRSQSTGKIYTAVEVFVPVVDGAFRADPRPGILGSSRLRAPLAKLTEWEIVEEPEEEPHG